MTARRPRFRFDLLDGEAWRPGRKVLEDLDGLVDRLLDPELEPEPLTGGFVVELDGRPWLGRDVLGDLGGASAWVWALREMAFGEDRVPLDVPDWPATEVVRGEGVLEVHIGSLSPRFLELDTTIEELVREARVFAELVDGLWQRLLSRERRPDRILPWPVRERIAALRHELPAIGPRAVQDVEDRWAGRPGIIDVREPWETIRSSDEEEIGWIVRIADHDLEHGPDDARFDALSRLIEIVDRLPDARAIALRWLEHPDLDPGSRVLSIELLGRAGRPEDVARLHPLLEHADPDVRGLALESIAALDPSDPGLPGAIEALLGRETDPSIRSRIARLAATIGGEGGPAEAVIDRLIELLRDPREWWFARVGAAEALGWYRGTPARVEPALAAAAAEDPDVNVRQAAQAALRALAEGGR